MHGIYIKANKLKYIDSERHFQIKTLKTVNNLRIFLHMVEFECCVLRLGHKLKSCVHTVVLFLVFLSTFS